MPSLFFKDTMNYAVILTFDKVSNTLLTGVWKKMTGCGIKAELLGSDVQPHITLAACEEVDFDSISSSLEKLTESNSRIDISLSHIGVFTNKMNVVYYGITVTDAFMDFHKKCHEAIHPHVTGSVNLYEPNVLVPHVTLCLDFDESMFPQAIDIARHEKLPIFSRVDRISLIDVVNLKEIASWKLV